MIYLRGVTYRYWLWPVKPLYGLEPTHPKVFSQPRLYCCSCTGAGPQFTRGGEATAGCSPALCNSLHPHIYFPLSQTILVCWLSGISHRQFIFPGHWGNEEALVGHAVDTLKYIPCCWLIADTLIHGRKGRPREVSIRDMNLRIVKEHVRQAIGILLWGSCAHWIKHTHTKRTKGDVSNARDRLSHRAYNLHLD